MRRVSTSRVLLLLAAGLLAGCQTPPSTGQTTPIADTPVVDSGATPLFAEWLAGFRSQAQAEGIRADVLDEAFAGVEPNPRIIELDSRQPEFARPIWEYLDKSVTDERVARGRRLLNQHRDVLSRIAGYYGVAPEYLVAIWAVETDFGRVLGDFSVIRSLTTLAYQGRRQAFGREQLMAALRIVQAGDATAQSLIGSWAGAMGQTQFIPTTFLAYAVDFDGDGRRDLWNSADDALASAARYLGDMGWRKGQSWGLEVRLPPGLDWQAADPGVARTLTEWGALGLTGVDGSGLAGDAEARLLLPAGASGPAFLTLHNFRVILRYNNASSYALAVSQLADRFNGAGGIVAAWPTHLTPLSRSERVSLQQALAARGLNPGPADGIIGPRTRSAVRTYQLGQGLPADGFPTRELLARLMEE